MPNHSALVSIRAKGSNLGHNTAQSLWRLYANCGRWQNGATNFVAVSDYDVVLASYRDYNCEAEGGLIQVDTERIEHPDGIIEYKPIYETPEAHIARVAKLNPLKYYRILNKELRDFLSKEQCYIHEVRSYHPINFGGDVQYGPLDAVYNEIRMSFDKLMPSGKFLIILPDCHITIFREWILDAFCKPPTPKAPEKIGNYYAARQSLDEDFLKFVNTASDFAGVENVVQVGDLLDHWHTHWMYDFAFDAYCDAKKSWTKIGWDRFPVELLDNRDVAMDPPMRKKLLDNWPKYFHEYLDYSGGQDKPPGSVKLAGSDQLIQNWHNHVTIMDVVAITFWKLGLDNLTPSITNVPPQQFKRLSSALSDPEEYCGLDYIPYSYQFKGKDTSEIWSIISTIRSSVGAPAVTRDKPIDIFSVQDIEDRIRAVHAVCKPTLLQFDTAAKNFVRGNHDTIVKNEYLFNKFSTCDTTSEPDKFVGQKNLELILDDKHVECTEQHTLRKGENDSVLIEHGDAWDRQNNDNNFYRFLVGHCWFDVHGELKNSGGARFVDADDGGYHMPKKKTLFVFASYNSDQLANPDGTLHVFSQEMGDTGLEVPAELRMKAIFTLAEKPPALVVLGHTHLPKLANVQISDDDFDDIRNAGRIYIDTTFWGKVDNAIDDVKDAVSSVANDISDTAKKVAGGISDAVEDVGEKLSEIGEDIADGVSDTAKDIAKGVSDVAGDVADAISDLFD